MTAQVKLIKLGGDLVDHIPTLKIICEDTKKGNWDILVGAGSEFSYVLNNLGVEYEFIANKYGVEERVIKLLYDQLQELIKNHLLPIQERRIALVAKHLHKSNNIRFMGPIHNNSRGLVNMNDDTYVHLHHKDYDECIVYAKYGSRKKHFNPLLVPKGNVEIRWVSKSF